MTEPVPIGTLARRAGVKVPTIRYYESIGLMPAAARTGSNRRAYGPEAERRLRFIRHARALGFEIDAIRDLLALADQPQRQCSEVDAIARGHLGDIDGKIVRLSALRDEIARMIGGCSHRRVADCRIIEVLDDHGKCRHDAH